MNVSFLLGLRFTTLRLSLRGGGLSLLVPPLIAPGPHLAGLASLVSALPSLSLFGPSPSHESLDILSVNVVLYKFKISKRR